jgi:hypothetical protein
VVASAKAELGNDRIDVARALLLPLLPTSSSLSLPVWLDHGCLLIFHCNGISKRLSVAFSQVSLS